MKNARHLRFILWGNGLLVCVPLFWHLVLLALGLRYAAMNGFWPRYPDDTYCFTGVAVDGLTCLLRGAANGGLTLLLPPFPLCLVGLFGLVAGARYYAPRVRLALHLAFVVGGVLLLADPLGLVQWWLD